MSDKKFGSALKKKIEELTRVKRWPATIVGEASRSGYSTVKFSNNLEMDVLNLRLSSVSGLKVAVGYDPISPGILQVLGIRETISILGTASNWVYWVANHHKNHEFPGPDTVWVSGEQFLPFNAVPTAGLTVRIYGGTLRGAGEWVAVGYEDIDLTSYQPTAGAKWVLIEIDNTGAVVITEGATVDSKELLVISGVPEPTPGRLQVAAFKLYDGQSTIHVDNRPYKQNDYLDLRWAGYSTDGNATSITTGVKNPPEDADKVVYRDSAASDAWVTSTWTQVKAFFKTYFDTLYAAPATTAANDFQVGDGAGAWIKKTLAQTRALIGGVTDSLVTANNDFLVGYWDAGFGEGWWVKKTLAEVKTILSLIPSSGWIEVTNTWTRTGNHTYTIGGGVDLTTDYRKGTKIRCKQGGAFIYGTIRASSFATPTNTITLITNDDHVLAAGAITDTAISPIENPEGFPAYFNYTPTLAGGGSMTIASSTIFIARWWAVKDVCHFTVDIDASFGGTAHSAFFVSPPVTPSTDNVAFAANCRDTSSGALPVGTGTVSIASGLIFRKADISVWTLAATRRVYGCGGYPF